MLNLNFFSHLLLRWRCKGWHGHEAAEQRQRRRTGWRRGPNGVAAGHGKKRRHLRVRVKCVDQIIVDDCTKSQTLVVGKKKRFQKIYI